MENSELHGIIIPLITPVDSDDRVDEGSFRKIIRHVIARGGKACLSGGPREKGRYSRKENGRG